MQSVRLVQLMKVLLGVHPPTHGEAFIFGLSVRDDLSAIQEVMGCCPQDDVLWTELTARDHLELYARFKGTPEAGLRTAVDTVLASVALLEDADQPVRNFSGGMKRRLSVGIAMIGTPQIIFLVRSSDYRSQADISVNVFCWVHRMSQRPAWTR